MPPANCLSPLTAGRHGSHALLPRAVGKIVGIPYMIPYGNILPQWCIASSSLKTISRLNMSHTLDQEAVGERQRKPPKRRMG